MGKTYLRCIVFGGTRKHPHAHGEDFEPENATDLRTETPPRSWGRLHVKHSLSIKPGNTPTLMGKTQHQQQQQRTSRKHPHAHGEDI